MSLTLIETLYCVSVTLIETHIILCECDVNRDIILCECDVDRLTLYSLGSFFFSAGTPFAFCHIWLKL